MLRRVHIASCSGGFILLPAPAASYCFLLRRIQIAFCSGEFFIIPACFDGFTSLCAPADSQSFLLRWIHIASGSGRFILLPVPVSILLPAFLVSTSLLLLSIHIASGSGRFTLLPAPADSHYFLLQKHLILLLGEKYCSDRNTKVPRSRVLCGSHGDGGTPGGTKEQRGMFLKRHENRRGIRER